MPPISELLELCVSRENARLQVDTKPPLTRPVEITLSQRAMLGEVLEDVGIPMSGKSLITLVRIRYGVNVQATNLGGIRRQNQKRIVAGLSPATDAIIPALSVKTYCPAPKLLVRADWPLEQRFHVQMGSYDSAKVAAVLRWRKEGRVTDIALANHLIERYHKLSRVCDDSSSSLLQYAEQILAEHFQYDSTKQVSSALRLQEVLKDSSPLIKFVGGFYGLDAKTLIKEI